MSKKIYVVENRYTHEEKFFWDAQRLMDFIVRATKDNHYIATNEDHGEFTHSDSIVWFLHTIMFDVSKGIPFVKEDGTLEVKENRYVHLSASNRFYDLLAATMEGPDSNKSIAHYVCENKQFVCGF